MDTWNYLGIKPYNGNNDGVALILNFPEKAILLNSLGETIKIVTFDMFSMLQMEAAENDCIIKVQDDYRDGPRPEGFPPVAEALWIKLDNVDGISSMNSI